MDTIRTDPPAISRQPRKSAQRWLWIILGLAVVVIAVVAIRGFGPGGHGTTDGKLYQCPMHPTVISDKPGDCPICGMKLVLMKTKAAASTSTPDQAVKYQCPMHPTVISDQPGDCPICGMKLVRMKQDALAGKAQPPRKKIMYRSTMTPGEVSDKPGKDAMGMEMVPFEVTEGDESPNVAGLAAVSITPEVRQLMGLKLGTVEKRSLNREVRTSALITADETRRHQVTVKTEGWVGKLYIATTGQQVKKGDPLLTLYSPELVSTQEEYLIALKSKATPGGESLLAATKRRLQLWDISDQQIRDLETSGAAEKYLTLYAPASGIVTDKQVVAGQKIMPGESLMSIADLSVVWGEADIYQSDLAYVQVGTPLALSLPFLPGQIFDGKVIFVSPTLDPETRSMRARLEIPNPEGLLKPGMYGDARLSYQRGDKLAIPGSAVMFSGKGSYAFKDGGEGRLIPVAIKIGARSDDWYELLDGLQEGDRIVTSANFLVDSESSMKAAIDAMINSSSASPTDSGHTGQQP
ncbi:MAG: efflux RND transporter periplasmic adaptor subunit [candidate division Zixibacteria bacterium]|nr:efflux RND transporter periplasmic adaptor subunit [candidate division Zixibacteria bacterium]